MYTEVAGKYEKEQLKLILIASNEIMNLRHPEVGTALLLRFCTCDHSQQLPRLNTKGQTRHPIKGVQTFVVMVILVAMYCSTRARPFGGKIFQFR